MGRNWSEDSEEGEEDEYPVNTPPPPPRPVPRQAARRAAAPLPPTTTVAARRAASRPPPKRDTFPLAVSAVVILLLVGLTAVFALNNGNAGAVSGTNNNPVVGSGTGGANPAGATTAPNTQANGQVAGVPTSIVSLDTPAPTSVDDAPRMPLADFKKLYDDPKTRPLILDVRAVDAYNQGHILGAISFPESDIDARIKELPKDKLIVAYCQ